MSKIGSQSSEAIHVKNEELENYFANTIIPQLFVDGNLILRKFTPPAMKHFRLSEEDIGKGIETVKDNIRYPTVIENIREVMRTAEILEKEIQTIDGRWFQMNILPYWVRKENRTNGVIITFVDITSRVRSLSQLEKLNSEHETLMFALSHDIRQPLSVISLLEEVMQTAFEKQNKTLFDRSMSRLKGAAQMVKSLIDSFVAANNLGPQLERKLERINIESTVDDITTALKSQHFTSENFRTDFQTSEILFSKNNLRSIVYNLINNAINYRQPGKELMVNISTRKEGDFVLLQVQDNGKGIAEEYQRKIFMKGVRIDGSIEGTGMGLYIIERMLASTGGKISLKSELGKGSSFTVYFKMSPELPKDIAAT